VTHTATPQCCGECGLALRWERVGAAPDERWLAVCACGMPWAFLPSRPNWTPDDPLAAALDGGRRSAGGSPPWIRLFQLTSGYPWWLPWRHVPGVCGCGQRVTFAVWTRLTSGRHAYSALCLGCGLATSEYVRAKGRCLSESPVSGNQWTPACVAVARLRRAVFA
jgi:hypothetical protein